MPADSLRKYRVGIRPVVENWIETLPRRGYRYIGSMMTSASPGRGGGDGSGAGASAASYRVIDNRSENLQQLRSLSIPLV